MFELRVDIPAPPGEDSRCGRASKLGLGRPRDVGFPTGCGMRRRIEPNFSRSGARVLIAWINPGAVRHKAREPDGFSAFCAFAPVSGCFAGW